MTNQANAAPINPEPIVQARSWQPHQTQIRLSVLMTAMQCVSRAMYENECLEEGGALYTKHDKVSDTVKFSLTWRDESGKEEEAPLLLLF